VGLEIKRGAKAGRGRCSAGVSEDSVVNALIQKVEGVVVLLLLNSQSLRSRPRRLVNFDLNLMTLCQQFTSKFNGKFAAGSVTARRIRFCSLRNLC